MRDQWTILYDRDCGFCRWSLAKILAWDRRRRLNPVAIQSAEGERLLADMPEEERLASWHLVGPDGEVRSAGAAFPDLLRLLPGAAPFRAFAERFPGFTERAYRWVSENRSTLAKPLGRHALQRADARIAARSVPR